MMKKINRYRKLIWRIQNTNTILCYKYKFKRTLPEKHDNFDAKKWIEWKMFDWVNAIHRSCWFLIVSISLHCIFSIPPPARLILNCCHQFNLCMLLNCITIINARTCRSTFNTIHLMQLVECIEVAGQRARDREWEVETLFNSL